MGKALNAGLGFLLGLILIFSAAGSGHALELGARAYYWFPSINADMRADEDGSRGTELDLEDDLGMGDENYPSVEIYGGVGRHHLSLMYTPIDYSGSTILNQDIRFEGKAYSRGTAVDADLEAWMLDLEYQVDLINLENFLAGFSLGAIGKVKYLDGEARLNSDAVGETKETFSLPIPMVGAGAHIGLLANILEARAKVTGIGYSGNVFYEAMADISWTPFPFLDLHCGYRHLKIDVDEDDFYLNSSFSGPFLALSVGF
ncbi:MAG: hypothetical protein A4E74_01058 [Syntrophus sp. PtaB.Bin075]|nr:MAG: hypothetical protein A4E74_01058 [Syntrophus sp. PtaB.Bin075]